MTVSLDQLPFDVFYHIASGLQLEDIVHLGQTCRQLKALLEEKTLHRRMVETHYLYTEEARLARLKETTYKQAFQAIYNRRHAFSTAYPFSARILGQGNTFLFRQGVLCILNGSTLSVVSVRQTFDTIELDLNSIIRPMFESGSPSKETITTSLLYYSDGILAVHATTESRANNGFIVALRTAISHPESRRVVRVIQLTSNSKLFVRHNARYLYYGTHTGLGYDGHHKWEISGVSLDRRYPLPNYEHPLLLEKFHGTDIGATVAFEIYKESFYAVSNQGTFEVEEVDWTSFYHCVRFPLNNPVAAAMKSNERVYRRQHAQGPIHDSWTDISLQLNECTNKTMIVESRREWAQASSRQSRTFYVSEFGLQSDHSSQASSPSAGPSDASLLPENDIFVSLLDSSNKPNYMPTPSLFSWSRHPEFAKEDISPRSFILARTKFRAYNYSCTSFLDLVEDERCCNDISRPPCIRLRIGSRRETSSERSLASQKGKGRMDEMEPDFEDNAKYYNSPIRMWPPPASRCPCAKRLHDILNPPLPTGTTHARTVTGVMDERTLVYMIKPGRSYGSGDDSTLGTIVLIDFTRALQSSDSTPSAPISMCCSDSNIDDEHEVKHDFNKVCWKWSPGLERRCRSGTCR